MLSTDKSVLESVGNRFSTLLRTIAFRRALVAGADLRQVFRVISKLDDEMERPRVVMKLTDLDDYVSQSTTLRDLVAFASTAEFGDFVAKGKVVEV